MSTAIQHTFSARLKRLMQERGLNQSQVADLAGVNQGRVSNWLNSKNSPTPRSLRDLAKALAVSVEALIPSDVQAASSNRKPTKNTPARFPGSVIVSRQEGVSHSHLYRVLLGERQSERLLKAYKAWIESNGYAYPQDAAQPQDT